MSAMPHTTTVADERDCALKRWDVVESILALGSIKESVRQAGELLAPVLPFPHSHMEDEKLTQAITLEANSLAHVAVARVLDEVGATLRKHIDDLIRGAAIGANRRAGRYVAEHERAREIADALVAECDARHLVDSIEDYDVASLAADVFAKFLVAGIDLDAAARQAMSDLERCDWYQTDESNCADLVAVIAHLAAEVTP